MTKPTTPMDRAFIEKRAEKTATCWLWLRSKMRTGYGSVVRNGQHMTAHRAAWISYNGPIPKGKLVLHTCDVRHCVNPAHLYLGTYSDNNNDMYARGRGGKRGRSGSKNSMAILTEEQVRLIKARLAIGETCLSIGRDFNVAEATIGCIKRGTRWTHV